MKIVLSIFFCLVFGLNAFGQAENAENVPEITVEEISLARGDKYSKIGETVNVFAITDIPIYCFVQLNSTKSAVIKMHFIVVQANGLKPQTKVVSVSYTTNGKQNSVTFNASPEKFWAAGKYRVDILIDGKPAKSLEFIIQETAEEIENTKNIEQKLQPKPKLKITRKRRKN
ncbi:MAG: hypothetical protein WKF71_01745 [Pyrinomonadaceae bacterium]